MKKNVLLLISFFLSALLCNTVSAQAPSGVFAKATTAPQVDGVVDAVWADATAYNIDQPVKTETPTLGVSGETTWQALWNNDGIYILLKVTDDVFFPNWAVTPAGNNWEYDKPEIYFDVNTVLTDGFGPGTAAPNNKGHYQVAPAFPQGKVDGTLNTQTDGITYAFLVIGNNYVAEYFVPFSKFLDKDGNQVKMNAQIGFDVQLIDRDVATTAKSRAIWANSLAETYTNMDACGLVTLSGGDLFIYATNLSLPSGSTITVDNGTLQMVPTIEPVNADNQVIKWSVIAGTGMATISSTGLLTAVADGNVTVKAASTDGSMLSATTEVVISGQITSKDEVWSGLNLIKNWNFDTDLTSWGNYVDATPAGQVKPVVVDGVVVMKAGKSTDSWRYQFNQSGLSAAANVGYTLKFKSWATADATPCIVDFEDTSANGYKRYGTSTDPEAVGGASEWKYNVNVTPQWFTFHVTFDKMVPSTVQKLQWMLSLSNETISIDSVLLVKDEYLVVKVNNIALNTEGTITTKGGTLQMTATVEPDDAANKTVTWSVTPEDMATISPEGLLTALANGTVTVKAVAADGSLTEATTDVVISGQLDGTELWSSSNNLIKNWNFDTDLATNWGSGWVDTGVAGAVKPVIVDGVAVMKVGKASDGNNWRYQFNQPGLTADDSVAYTLKFKSWATADATPCVVDFEDIQANKYRRYGASTDSESAGGRSEWHYTVDVNPKWFTFHVTFDSILPTTVQKIQWMLSLSNETISLDSVLLIKDEFLVPVAEITLNTEGTIETNRGTLQMSAVVAPEYATDKKVTWSVSPEGLATISSEGLLSALANGTVIVKATAADGSMTEATTDVVISGQVSEKELWSSEFNLIKNWNFDTDMTLWGGWVDNGVAGQVKPAVVDSVAVMKVGKASDGNSWHYQHNQENLGAEPNVAYVLKFKSWASADNTPCAVDFESGSTITSANGGDQWVRYGSTTDPESGDLKSEWHYNVNTTPQWFTFHVTFDNMIPTTIQKLQWMLSLSNETISLDSILLVKEEYLTMEPSPVANAGADVEVNEGAVVTLDASKSVAPNAEALTYRWVAPAGITLSSTTEAKPTFTAPAVTADKTYTLSLVVSYGTVKPIADQVVITVKQVDAAPTIKTPIPNISVYKGAAVKVIDLTKVFADADGDVITYSVVNSNNDVVSSFISSGSMTISFSTINIGTSVMEVTATSNGKSVKATINIEVRMLVGIESMGDDATMQVYPNPTRGKTEVKLGQVAKAGTMITVYNTTGQVIYKTVTAKMSTTIDLSGNPAGMYFIKVGQKTSKLILE